MTIIHFGDCVTADHIIVGEKQESKRHDTVAVIVQDRATYWLAGYPKASKTTEDTVAALQHFVGPNDKVKFFYTDGSGELESAAKIMKWIPSASQRRRRKSRRSGYRWYKELVVCLLVWTPMVG